MKIISFLKTHVIETTVIIMIIGALIALISVSMNMQRLPAQAAESSSNPGIVVELVLEHEGIKIYRFWDGLRTIYYTDARGRTSWQEVHSTGKSTYMTEHEVETER